MSEKIKVSIAGASGFTGRELVKLLIRHNKVEIGNLFSRTHAGEDIAEIFPSLRGVISHTLTEPSPAVILNDDCDVIFLALPHTKSFEYVKLLIGKKKLIVDLSADYRFSDPAGYRDCYHFEHQDTENLKDAVYGIPEINRNKIKGSRLIANPGCYATAAILSIYPLLKEGVIENSVYIDAKSGISGAGKKLDDEYLFSKRYENITPYKVNSHRHMGEIIEFLSKVTNSEFNLIFCPHLIPIERGILSNLYTKIKGNFTEENIRDIFLKYYGDEEFIKLYPSGRFPQTKDVDSTNNCNIALKYDSRTCDLIVITAIDNLIKGASGQAVQNMNIALGFEESAGLK